MKKQYHFICQIIVFATIISIGIGTPFHESAVWGDDSTDVMASIPLQIIKAIDRLLILQPFDMAVDYGINVNVQGPLTGKVFITGEVAPEASDFLLPHLNALFGQLDLVHLVYLKKDQRSANASIDALSDSRSLRISKIQTVGRENGANGVLCTYIYAFQERVGRDYGVNRPAKVAMEMNLVSVDSGAVLWQAHFSETQQALNENLFQIGKFFKRGGRWITAREMAVNAVEDLITAFEKEYLSEESQGDK